MEIVYFMFTAFQHVKHTQCLMIVANLPVQHTRPIWNGQENLLFAGHARDLNVSPNIATLLTQRRCASTDRSTQARGSMHCPTHELPCLEATYRYSKQEDTSKFACFAASYHHQYWSDRQRVLTQHENNAEYTTTTTGTTHGKNIKEQNSDRKTIQLTTAMVTTSVETPAIL